MAYLRAKNLTNILTGIFSFEEKYYIENVRRNMTFFFVPDISLCVGHSSQTVDMFPESLFYFPMWYEKSLCQQKVEMSTKAKGSIWTHGRHGRSAVYAWGWQGLILTSSYLEEAKQG